jgi:hypothetical protein
MVQCWEGNVAGFHLCVLRRILTLLEWRCKEALVNQQGGCSTTRDIQTFGAANIGKWFEFVSIENDSVA